MWALLERRAEVLKADPVADRMEVNRPVRRSAQAHKKQRLLEGIGVGGTMKDRWKAVRNVKRHCPPGYYTRKAVDGGTFMARHLAFRLWGTPQDSPRNHETRSKRLRRQFRQVVLRRAHRRRAKWRPR